MGFPAVGHALAAALLIAGAPGGRPAQAEVAGLAGTWRCVSGDADGHRAPDAAAAKMRLVLRPDGTYRNDTGDGNASEGTFVVHRGPGAWMIDLKCRTGPLPGKTLFCIYERKGDELRLCHALFGTDRPTEFTSGAGSRHVLMAFRREAAK